ncbi:MAG: DinB family protein [Candidatus Promineifilaceae bacterium]|nr:DinB family protein [Candidatus Promineifilaceae bacterium]
MNDEALRQHLLNLLDGRGAHMTFDQAVVEFPPEAMNRQPPNVPYTPWHLIEHLRIAQWDILQFVRDPEHDSPAWPDGYWPERSATTDTAGWDASLTAFRSDLEAMKEIVRDRDVELTAELPHAPGYTYLREVLLVADHNAYHVGEFAILRQVMGTWPDQR